jgi:Tat protein translocase TatB subunit
MNNMLLFLNMSGGEILVIVLVAYLVLGPKKIPEIARMVGKGINELRRATDDIKNEFTKEMNNFKREANLNIKDPFIPDAYKRPSPPTLDTSPAPEKKEENKSTEEEMK